MRLHATPNPARRIITGHKATWRKARDRLAWLTLGIAFLNLFARYGPGHAHEQVRYNADALFIPIFFGDVTTRASLAGWDLPTSPFFFPDMLLFFPLLAMIANTRIAALLFGLLQLALLCVGMVWLQRQLFTKLRAAQTYMLLVLAVLLLLIATGRQAVFPFAFLSVHHMSVLVVMPVVLVALLWSLQAPSPAGRGRALLQLYALTLLTTHSETLFIIQFVLPALGALLLWGKSPLVSWRYLGSVAVGLLIAAAAGQWLRRFLVPPDKLLLYTNLTVDAMAVAWTNFVAWVADLIRTDPLFVIVWIVGVALLIAVVTSALRQRSEEARTLALVATLALASMIASLAAAIGSGNFIDAYATRYILPTVYLPLLVGLPVGLARWHTTAHARILPLFTAAATIATLALLVSTTPLLTPAAWRAYAAYQDPLVACLQQEGAQRRLRYGLANFWQAGLITALANGTLEVVAVGRDLSPVLWNNNRYRYDAPFEFVVIAHDAEAAWQINRQFVIGRLGIPHDEFVCADQTILVYNQPAAGYPGTAPIRQWFAHHPALANVAQPGDVAELYGYTLPTHIGAVAVGLSLGASEQWDQDEGRLAVAPLKALAAGSYAVRLDLYADHDNPGTWEVVAITQQGRQLLHRAPITQGGSHALTGHFDLETEADVDVVVEYNGRGALYVDRILVARVDPAHATTFDFDMLPASHVPAPHVPAHQVAAPHVQPPAVEPGTLHLLYPPPGSTVKRGEIDFVWQWTGARLPPGEGFEVRLWRAGTSTHFGAHDAIATQDAIRRIGDTYILRLDLRGAYSVRQHGAGDYAWTVARVLVEPAYQDLQQESALFALTVQP